MERVNKGEEYWFIDKDGEILWRYESYSCQDDMMFNYNNYFHTREEAEAMAEKIRKVLKGADVIEMPREEEIKQAAYDCTNGYDDDQIPGFKEGVEWLKSKCIR